MQNITGVKFRLFSRDIQRSVRFYEHLGFCLSEQWKEINDEGAIVSLNSQSDFPICIEITKQQIMQSTDSVSIQLKVDNLEAYMHQIKGNIIFGQPVKRPWGSLYLYLEDPSGYQVIVYQE